MSTETPENQATEQTTAATPPVEPAAPAQAQASVSSVADFRKKKQEREAVTTLELPSGAFVKVKRPSVQAMIRDGHIPADVASALQATDPTMANQLTGDQMKQYLRLLDLVVIESVVEPHVVPVGQGDENSVAVDELEDSDKAFIMAYVQLGVKDLARFRSE